MGWFGAVVIKYNVLKFNNNFIPGGHFEYLIIICFPRYSLGNFVKYTNLNSGGRVYDDTYVIIEGYYKVFASTCE